MDAFGGGLLRVLKYLVAVAHVFDKSVPCNALEFGNSVGQAWPALPCYPCQCGNYATQACGFCGCVLVRATPLIADVNRTNLLCVVLCSDGDAEVFMLDHFFSTESEWCEVSLAD